MEKAFEELQIKDDFMFSIIMRNPKLFTVSSGVTVFADGGSKTFYLPEGEAYSFTYTGNGTGIMDIEITEYEADGTLLRTANFNHLPLAKGTTYGSEDNGKFFWGGEAEYRIKDSEVYAAGNI